ncbi:MAG: hypothetical protein GF346_05630 [Candidatus Eisenbacteria bacterium]|nr:hypothetical protein [Candidatus Latescibacterota bacterium]MBD3301909.1 hypothetical protein [Candidatus Eisenbacteria bacterium]
MRASLRGGQQWAGASRNREPVNDIQRWLRERFPKARWEEPEGALGLLTHRVRLPGRAARVPADHLFLDLETLGFVGRPLFLIGLLHADPDGRMRLVQLLARDYAEEEATLRYFSRIYGPYRAWVTFNGKSFDVPSLRLRCAFHRLPPVGPETHVDLLHLARRHFRGVFEDCRLKTLERRICGRHRIDDLDGARVPDAYHRWVRESDPSWLEPILRHNRDDLVTLAELYANLIDIEESEKPEEP